MFETMNYADIISVTENSALFSYELEGPGFAVLEIDGREYLLMKPIRADFALLGTYKCDEAGNCWYKGTMRNFNTVMATAADTVIAECEHLVPVGGIEPENIHTYGMCVDYIVEGEAK